MKIIALDCDDVLTEYNKRWGELYAEFFQLESLPVVKPNAHYNTHRFGITWENREKERVAFDHYFNEKGWATMYALEGAAEATHMLKDMGYKIFVVTRMPKHAENHRTDNLNSLGITFDAVIGAGHAKHKLHNPKKEYINALEPEYFVDDLMDNFHEISENVKLVWLDLQRDPTDNYHLFKDIKLHDKHPNLLNFVNKLYYK